MTEPVRYSQEPVELPLDPWILTGKPKPDCEVCESQATQRNQALKQNDWRSACAADRRIRNHEGGHQ